MRLAAAGRRAGLRADDFAAQLNLVERALELVPEDEIDAQAGVRLSSMRAFKVDVTDAAASRAVAGRERQSSAGEQIAELCGRVLEGVIGMHERY